MVVRVIGGEKKAIAKAKLRAAIKRQSFSVKKIYTPSTGQTKTFTVSNGKRTDVSTAQTSDPMSTQQAAQYYAGKYGSVGVQAKADDQPRGEANVVTEIDSQQAAGEYAATISKASPQYAPYFKDVYKYDIDTGKKEKLSGFKKFQYNIDVGKQSFKSFFIGKGLSPKDAESAAGLVIVGEIATTVGAGSIKGAGGLGVKVYSSARKMFVGLGTGIATRLPGAKSKIGMAFGKATSTVFGTVEKGFGLYFVKETGESAIAGNPFAATALTGGVSQIGKDVGPKFTAAIKQYKSPKVKAGTGTQDVFISKTGRTKSTIAAQREQFVRAAPDTAIETTYQVRTDFKGTGTSKGDYTLIKGAAKVTATTFGKEEPRAIRLDQDIFAVGKKGKPSVYRSDIIVSEGFGVSGSKTDPYAITLGKSITATGKSTYRLETSDFIYSETPSASFSTGKGWDLDTGRPFFKIGTPFKKDFGKRVEIDLGFKDAAIGGEFISVRKPIASVGTVSTKTHLLEYTGDKPSKLGTYNFEVKEYKNMPTLGTGDLITIPKPQKTKTDQIVSGLGSLSDVGIKAISKAEKGRTTGIMQESLSITTGGLGATRGLMIERMKTSKQDFDLGYTSDTTFGQKSDQLIGQGFEQGFATGLKLDTLKGVPPAPPPTVTDVPFFTPPPSAPPSVPPIPPLIPWLPRRGAGPQSFGGLGLIKIKPRYMRAASPTAALFNIKATKRQRKQEKFTGLELIGLR